MGIIVPTDTNATANIIRIHLLVGIIRGTRLHLYADWLAFWLSDSSIFPFPSTSLSAIVHYCDAISILSNLCTVRSRSRLKGLYISMHVCRGQQAVGVVVRSVEGERIVAPRAATKYSTSKLNRLSDEYLNVTKCQGEIPLLLTENCCLSTKRPSLMLQSTSNSSSSSSTISKDRTIRNREIKLEIRDESACGSLGANEKEEKGDPVGFRLSANKKDSSLK
ncbi:hypothetical protein V1478_017110 [Vespula squamosa]|uniref:Uncharacterized protein n=1 Tax=Vespula squamosa TaxID=30214 RepID=A0ABD1ZYY1_VESSQ